MWAIVQWLISYILGGISFVLLLLIAAFSLVYVWGSTPIGDLDVHKFTKGQLEHKALEEEEEAGGPADANATIDGWLTVRRQFEPDKDGKNSSFLGQPHGEHDEAEGDKSQHHPHKHTYSSRIAQTYRSLTNTAKKSDAPRDFYWCKLVGPVFYVQKVSDEKRAAYEEHRLKNGITSRNEDEHRPPKDILESVAVMDMRNFKVQIEDKHGNTDISEGKLFSKRNAIVLRFIVKDGEKRQGLPVVAKGMSSNDNMLTADQEAMPWFCFSKSNFKAENWYLALLQKSRARPTTNEVWSSDHMRWLQQRIVDQTDKSGLHWLNALIGRVFLGITHTALVEQFIIDRINRKLAMISHPLIGPLIATEVNLGHIPPTLSNVMLKDFTPDGELSFVGHMDYRQPEGLDSSGVRITIEATKIGFKAVLAVVVKSMSGDMIVKVKPAPSDRIWWAFMKEPKMDISIQPVLGSRTINWGYILSFIEKKMREGIADSVVLPYMDDTPFFMTGGLQFRGGIFDCASKKAYAEEQQHQDDSGSDAKSIGGKSVSEKSEKGDKSDKNADAKSIASVKSTEGDRRHSKKRQSVASSIREEDVRETNAVHRSETTPMPGAAKKAGSIRRFSRPASPKKDASFEEQQRLPHDGTKGFDLQPSVEVPVPPSPTTSMMVQERGMRSDTPSTMSSDTLHDDTLDHASTMSRTTTQSLVNAVRARDKAALQGQVNVAKDSVKKWGVTFINKRRQKTGGDDGDDGSLHSAQSTPALSHPTHAPSHRSPPSPEDHHPRGSLQERLAAAAARSHEINASQGRNSTSTASIETPPSPIAIKPSVPARPVHSANQAPPSAELAPAESAPAELASAETSIPQAVPPPVRSPIVPRADVAAIVHSSAPTSPTDSPPPEADSGSKPRLPRTESDPAPSTVLPLDHDGATDKAVSSVAAITAASVTTRTTQAGTGNGTSPARESLLASHKASQSAAQRGATQPGR